MRTHHRSLTVTPILLALALSSLVAATPTATLADAVTITSVAPGAEDAAIIGMAVEDFEDVNLLPGLTIILSTWRDNDNNTTAQPAVTYTGTLPTTWAPTSIGYPANAWDGTHTFVNGAGFAWAFPYAASMEFRFDPPRAAVGLGFSNLQTDVSSTFTPHTIRVNDGVEGTLEALPGWVSTDSGKNGYVVFSGTSIESIRITADTHFDGMVVDKLAVGGLAVPVAGSSWGQVKALFR